MWHISVHTHYACRHVHVQYIHVCAVNTCMYCHHSISMCASLTQTLCMEQPSDTYMYMCYDSRTLLILYILCMYMYIVRTCRSMYHVRRLFVGCIAFSIYIYMYIYVCTMHMHLLTPSLPHSLINQSFAHSHLLSFITYSLSLSLSLSLSRSRSLSLSLSLSLSPF